jgi:hypothetical protein
MVDMVSVVSSNIKAVGHDKETATLYVSFHSGGLYAYPEVSEAEYKAFIEADSVGKHFHKMEIKNRGVKQEEASI